MNNKEKLVSALSNDELKCLVSAASAYVNMLRKYNRDTRFATDALHKVLDAYTLSNYLSATEIKADANARIGSAEYKAYEAMYDSDVRAHR